MKPLWKVKGFFNRTSWKVYDVQIVRKTWVLSSFSVSVSVSVSLSLCVVLCCVVLCCVVLCCVVLCCVVLCCVVLCCVVLCCVVLRGCGGGGGCGGERGGGGREEKGRLIEPSGPKFPSRLPKLNSLKTIRWLIPSAVSLRIAETEQLYQAQRMFGGIGNVLLSTYSQTENGEDPLVSLVNL